MVNCPGAPDGAELADERAVGRERLDAMVVGVTDT